MFINLRVTFDAVDREILIRLIREKWVKKESVARIKKVIRETKSKIRVKERTGKKFWKRKV